MARVWKQGRALRVRFRTAVSQKRSGAITFGLRQGCKSLTIGVAEVSASCCGVNLAAESRACPFVGKFERGRPQADGSRIGTSGQRFSYRMSGQRIVGRIYRMER
jgi:hypothetical protein